jgi:hypothetical protein
LAGTAECVARATIVAPRVEAIRRSLRLLDAGVEHLIVELPHPFEFSLVDRLLTLAR